MEPAFFLLPPRQAIRSFALLPAFAATTTLQSPPPPSCHSARRWRKHLASLAMQAPILPLLKPPPPQSGPKRRRKTTDGLVRVTCIDRAKSCRNQNTRRPIIKSTKISCWRTISVMRGRKERVCRASILARWGQGGRVQGRVWRLVDSRAIRPQRRNGRQMMSLLQSPWTETTVISRLAMVSASAVPLAPEIGQGGGRKNGTNAKLQQKIWREQSWLLYVSHDVKAGALSRQSIHINDNHGKQEYDDSRKQVQLSGANGHLDNFQPPPPPLTNEVLLNNVELGEPLFTEEELTLAMTRTTISPLVE